MLIRPIFFRSLCLLSERGWKSWLFLLLWTLLFFRQCIYFPPVMIKVMFSSPLYFRASQRRYKVDRDPPWSFLCILWICCHPYLRNSIGCSTGGKCSMSVPFAYSSNSIISHRLVRWKLHCLWALDSLDTHINILLILVFTYWTFWICTLTSVILLEYRMRC